MVLAASDVIWAAAASESWGEWRRVIHQVPARACASQSCPDNTGQPSTYTPSASALLPLYTTQLPPRSHLSRALPFSIKLVFLVTHSRRNHADLRQDL